MRRTPNPAITPRMYRHFAVLTLVFTAAVGFFASGENGQAAAERVAQEKSAEVADNHGAADEAREPAKPIDPGTWGDDDGGAFGQPMISGSAVIGSWISDGAAWRPQMAQRGYGNEDPLQLTRQDRNDLAQAIARNVTGSATKAKPRPTSAPPSPRIVHIQ